MTPRLAYIATGSISVVSTDPASVLESTSSNLPVKDRRTKEALLQPLKDWLQKTKPLGSTYEFSHNGFTVSVEYTDLNIRRNR